MPGHYVQSLPEHFYRTCAHGVQVHFARCHDCEVEREAERVAEARRVGDPAQRILDAIEARRPWYRRCAFCTHASEAAHDADCPWKELIAAAMYRAWRDERVSAKDRGTP